MNVAAVQVGKARVDDAAAVADGVTALIRELRGDPAHTIAGLEKAVMEAIGGDPRSGGVLVARAQDVDETVGGRVVGVLGYSIQCALRVAGAYCLIQEVWVTPALRSAGVARMLLDELARECAGLGVRRVEVCLPHPAFPAFDRTQAFYERNGFRALGPRLIRDLT